MTIEENKIYKTANGCGVTFYAFYPNQNVVHGAYCSDKLWFHMAWRITDGTSYNTAIFNLIEVSPYIDFKVDDLVEAYSAGRDEPNGKRYFARLSDKGKPLCWRDGRTSKTAHSESDITLWDHIEKVK